MLHPQSSIVPDGTPLSREALVDIYLGIRPRLEKAIERRVGSHSVAYDIAQSIFIRLGAITVDLCSRQDAEHYLIRIAINASLDYIKMEKRRSVLLKEVGEIYQKTYHSPEVEMLMCDDMRQVEAALAELPSKCRDVLYLSRLLGYTNTEIANRLGVSLSLVEKYLSRSLSHCRKRLIESDNRI